MKRLTTRWFRQAVPHHKYCQIVDVIADKHIRVCIHPCVGGDTIATHTYCVAVDMNTDADIKWLIKKMFGIGKVDRQLCLVWSRHPDFSIKPTFLFSEDPVFEKDVLLSWVNFVKKHNRTSRSRGEARHKWKDWIAWYTQGSEKLDPLHITPPNHPVPTRLPI